MRRQVSLGFVIWLVIGLIVAAHWVGGRSRVESARPSGSRSVKAKTGFTGTFTRSLR